MTWLETKIGNQLTKIRRAARLSRARRSGASIGNHPWLGPEIEFHLGQREGRAGEITIGEHAWIEKGAVLQAFGGHIRLQRSVFLGPYVVIYGHGGVDIGEETLISMHCCILSSNHDVPGCDRIIRQQPDILLPTKIGRDVWLGAGVKVLGGVTIGDGCVVGAGAVVTKDLPPGTIAVGVPALAVRNRNENIYEEQ
ncbi:MAG: acyltransferase [Verrucomicrobiota bacterium]